MAYIGRRKFLANLGGAAAAKSRIRLEAGIVQAFDCVLMPCSGVTPVVSLRLPLA